MLQHVKDKRPKKPQFIDTVVWDKMCTYWDSLDFKKKSEIAKKNWAFETGGSLHTGGSIIFLEVKRKLVSFFYISSKLLCQRNF